MQVNVMLCYLLLLQTVFAYGQTGSGKTWTMGSEYRPGSAVRSNTGVIPEAINAIFNRIATLKDWQASVRVSFVEIHKV
jgi:kinesin family protein 4/21/27